MAQLFNVMCALQITCLSIINYIAEFIENQCSYEKYLNGSLVYADELLFGLTEKQCQERCATEGRFRCIGATYRGKYFTGTRTNTECQLHSDDIIALGPRSVRSAPGSIYMRRVRCLNSKSCHAMRWKRVNAYGLRGDLM